MFATSKLASYFTKNSAGCRSCTNAATRQAAGSSGWPTRGRETDFIFVLISGGPGRDQGERDFSHFGFALESRVEVDAIADKATAAACLAWPPRDEPYPVGYYCGLRDPDGNFVEFSYGQPLGPGAPSESG